MKNLIKKNLNGKIILFLFTLTNIVYAIMLLITIPKVMQYSGGMKLLDMLPTGYDHDYVRAFLDTLGSQGRDIYLHIQLPVDMIYPGLFGISYSLMTAYFLNKLNKLDSYLFYFCFIPIFSGIFDYSENIGIIFMLNNYPDNSILLTQVTSVFSVLKSSFTAFYFISLILLLIALGKQKLLLLIAK